MSDWPDIDTISKEPRREPKVHHAWIERATESDNEEWVWLTCGAEPDRPRATNKWDEVNCLNCIRAGRRKP